MAVTTLTVLGGSGVATPALISALLNWTGNVQDRPDLRVVLVGRAPEKLEPVRAVCQEMVEGARPPLEIEATTDLRFGVQGADYVLNQMRVGGLDARAHDETFPHALGFPGEETIGPGGFANALRTIPVVNWAMEIVSEVAPNAVVLNLTNPASIVHYAVDRYTYANMISLCDSPITLIHDVAELVDRPLPAVQADYLGMNHLGWVISLRDGDQDLMDMVLERIERLVYLGVDASYLRASRAIPLPYLRYYLYPERIRDHQQGTTPRARQLQALEQELLSVYGRPEARGETASSAVTKRSAVWYRAIIVPILDALINDHAATWVVNQANGERVPWLPPETVIEAPCQVDRKGVHPLPVPAHLLPLELRALLTSLALYEELAAPAIVERDRELALRALVAHPMVRTVEHAERVLNAVWPGGGV